MERLDFQLNEELNLVENYLNNRKIATFRQFSEDMSGVPANNAAATPGVAALTGEPPVGKKGMFRRKANVKLA